MTRVPEPWRPALRDFSLAKAARLAGAAVAFLALCASLVFLVLPVGELMRLGPSAEILILLLAGLAALAASGFLLHVLMRYPRTERQRLAGDPVVVEFRRRRRLMSAAGLSLFVIMVLLGLALRPMLGELATAVGALVFLGGYYAAGRALHRCPACDAQLRFMDYWVYYPHRTCFRCGHRLQ